MRIITSNPGKGQLSQRIMKDAELALGIHMDDLVIKDVYEIQGASEESLRKIEARIFKDDTIEYELVPGQGSFRYHPVPGQYNEREDMVEKMVQDLLGLDGIELHHSILMETKGLSESELEAFKNYQLNPIEYLEIPMDYEPKDLKASSTEDLDEIQGFIHMDDDQLEDLAQSFSMDLDDLKYVRDYFKGEGRNPNTTELKVIDTYWSDHCRHTTFNTELEEIDFEDGPYRDLFRQGLQSHLYKREVLEREDKPLTLMDLGTIQTKFLKSEGKIADVVLSEEVNACTLDIEIDTDHGPRDYTLYFKNETHNHPTEIEPFGGASTCLGGGIRDPLSGRGYIYQSMRITGAKDPNTPVSQTREGKLPQRAICQKAAEGFSDYGNQIGIAQSYLREFYHDGFEAKRMEVGALIGAAPSENIVREEPSPSDRVILIGGRTGRDGLGAAVGSSMVQTEDSLENQGAEVQKGNPSVERKIVRLFKNGQATRLIKRCNDFGAGGVSVAVGELTDGLLIDLNAVRTKYQGMHGGEIALSESQERMAAVVGEKDVEKFLAFCQAEDVEAYEIAEVNDSGRLVMTWNGQEIVNISREFLDSNGAPKFAKATLISPTTEFPQVETTDVPAYVQDINRASQRALGSIFDSTACGQTVFYPWGGKYQATPELGNVSKLPHPTTTTVSAMTMGFDPKLAEFSPYHGGYFAVVDSIAKLAAMGFDYQKTRLSFQEFFERLGDDPKKWGKPLLALLGANEVLHNLEVPTIGGKDSMSGSFEDLDVPPTLISFAVNYGHSGDLISRAFKEVGSKVLLIEHEFTNMDVIDLDQFKRTMKAIYKYRKDILAASTVGIDGPLKDLVEMSFGNRIGLESDYDELTKPMMGAFILEVPQDFDESVFKNGKVLGRTIEGELRLVKGTYKIEELEKLNKAPLAQVYEASEVMDIEKEPVKGDTFQAGKIKKALIPVLLGTNAEYDYQGVLEKAGIEVETYIFKSVNMDQSIEDFLNKLDGTDLLILPHGAVYGNEPDSPSTGWRMVLNRPEVAEKINTFVKENYILGTGTGLDALLCSGLIEFGQIQEGSKYQLDKNPGDYFVSAMARGHIVNGSLLTNELIDRQYTVSVASKWLSVNVGEDFDKLYSQGQIISTFTQGIHGMKVDGIQDKSGHILGFVSNIERMSEDLYINLGSEDHVNFFENLK